MKCDDLLKALNEYVDGTLLFTECAAFESHLAGCHPCRIVVDNIRHTITLFRGDTPYPMPDEFRQSLRRSLKASWKQTFP